MGAVPLPLGRGEGKHRDTGWEEKKKMMMMRRRNRLGIEIEWVGRVGSVAS